MQNLNTIKKVYTIIKIVSFIFLISFTHNCICQKSFFVDSLELFYEEYGSGPPVYILSGGPGEAPTQSYHLIVDSLKSNYTCILMHQRGSGKSRKIPVNKKTITIENYTKDIEALRKHRGDKKISLLGVSWGGLLAMNYSVKYSKNVSKIILVCSAPPSYKLWHFLYDNQFSRRSVAEIDSMNYLSSIFSSKTEKELDSIKLIKPNSPEILDYKEFILLHVRAMYYDRSKINKSDYERLFYEFNFQPIPIIDNEVLNSKFDITAQLKKLKIPTLIVYGRQDDQGESTFYLQKECFKNSEMYVIEQCGHEILEEQPKEFFKILIPWLIKFPY